MNQSGSASAWRAMPMISASPLCRIDSACSKVVIPPVATIGVSSPTALTARLIAPTSGTERPNGPRASDSVVDAIAAGDYFVAEKTHTDHVIVADRFAHRAINFERQAHTIFTWPAITIAAVIQRAQKARHRVRVRVVQLDAVKSNVTRAPRGLGKNRRQHLRQFANVRQMRISHPLAITEAQ